jgi:hypothetical protein
VPRDSSKTNPQAQAAPPAEPPLIWGQANISREINCSIREFGKLYRGGFFGDAVYKVGHRSYVGVRARLHARVSV